LDRRWRSGEIQKDIDERTRSFDDRKKRGELTAVEQIVEAVKSRQEGESQSDTIQRLFGTAEGKEAVVYQTGQLPRTATSAEHREYLRRASSVRRENITSHSLEETRHIMRRGQLSSTERQAELIAEMIANDQDGEDEDDEGGSNRPEEKPPHSPVPPINYDSSSSSDGGRKRGRGKIGRFGFTKSDGELQFADEDGLLSYFNLRSNVMDTYEFPDLLYDGETDEIFKVSFEEVIDNYDWIPEDRDSDKTEECDSNHSCYMAKMEKSISKVMKGENPNEALNYCLDNMANISVFRNKDLLEKIETTDEVMQVTGVGSKVTNIDKTGMHPLFGKCYYCPGNEYNVLSQWQAQTKGFKVSISEDNESTFLIRESDNIRIEFKRDPRDRFYKCSFSELEKAVTNSNVYKSV
jgi:hypothetical protein